MKGLFGLIGRTGAGASPRLVDPNWRFHWPVGIGFALLCFLLNYPGRLNADSLFSVVAAEAPGLTNNWHSATLGWFWSLPAPLTGQPAAALIMQVTLFGIFAGFLPRFPRNPREQAVLTGELLLRLVLSGSLGYICKDSTIFLTLLIAVQLVRRSIGRGFSVMEMAIFIAVIALFLLSKTPNFMVIVVAGAVIAPFFVRSWRCYLVLMIILLVAGALAIPLNRTVDSRIFAARNLHPDKQLVLFDLAGISVRTGQNAFDSVRGWPTSTLPSVASCYVPYMWDSFAHWTPCGGYSAAYDRLDGPLTQRWLIEIARILWPTFATG